MPLLVAWLICLFVVSNILIEYVCVLLASCTVIIAFGNGSISKGHKSDMKTFASCLIGGNF